MPQPSRLPGPNADSWDWQLTGACRGYDSAVFFHPDGERGRARAQREQRAKAICHQCPVIAQCRQYALETDEPYGIWGGLSESERARIRLMRYSKNKNSSLHLKGEKPELLRSTT